MPCSCSRSAAATPSATSRRISCGHSSSHGEVGAAVYGIVGRDGGYTAEVADAVVVIPPLYVRSSHAAHRRVSARSCGTSWCPIPSCNVRRRSGRARSRGERMLRERSARIGTSWSWAAPASSAAIWCARCSRAPASNGVVVYDNFTSGRRWHLEPFADDPRLDVVEGEVHDLERLTASMTGATAVVHLASNPDIARAMTDPTIDFDQGTQLTHCVVEAARRVVGRARSLRLGQRRVRRSRRATRPTKTTARSNRSRPTARASSPARPCSRRTATCSACAAVPSASETSSGPTRPTASASTSCASSSPIRPGSRSSATAPRASRTSTSTTSSRRCCWRRERAPSRSPCSTSRPATTSPSREIAGWRSSALGLDPLDGRVRLQRWGPGMEG